MFVGVPLLFVGVPLVLVGVPLLKPGLWLLVGVAFLSNLLNPGERFFDGTELNLLLALLFGEFSLDL